MAETETAASASPTTTTSSKKKPGGKRDRNHEPKQSSITENAVISVKEEEELISEGSSEWSKEESKLLISIIHKQIPKNDKISFNRRIVRLNWDKIKIKGRTSVECRHHFKLMLQDIRHFRLLDEILIDMQCIIENPATETVKKPLTSFFLFFQAKREEIKRNNPGCDMPTLAREAGRLYRGLTAKKRKKYDRKANSLKAEYSQKIASIIVKKSNLNKIKRPTPFNLYCEFQHHHGKIEKYTKYREQYNALSNDEKVKWIKASVEKTASIDGNDNPLSILTKDEKILLEGKPKIVPSAYHLFIKDCFSKDKDEPRNIKTYSDKWKEMDQSKKNIYIEKYSQMEAKFKKDMADYIQNLPMDKRQKHLELLLQKTKTKKIQQNDINKILRNEKLQTNKTAKKRPATTAVEDEEDEDHEDDESHDNEEEENTDDDAENDVDNNNDENDHDTNDEDAEDGEEEEEDDDDDDDEADDAKIETNGNHVAPVAPVTVSTPPPPPPPQSSSSTATATNSKNSRKNDKQQPVKKQKETKKFQKLIDKVKIEATEVAEISSISVSSPGTATPSSKKIKLEKAAANNINTEASPSKKIKLEKPELEEPSEPPSSTYEYYKRKYGEVGEKKSKYLEFKRLTPEKRKELEAEYEKVKQLYLKELEKYLKSLTVEQRTAYAKKVNANCRRIENDYNDGDEDDDDGDGDEDDDEDEDDDNDNDNDDEDDTDDDDDDNNEDDDKETNKDDEEEDDSGDSDESSENSSGEY